MLRLRYIDRGPRVFRPRLSYARLLLPPTVGPRPQVACYISRIYVMIDLCVTSISK